MSTEARVAKRRRIWIVGLVVVAVVIAGLFVANQVRTSRAEGADAGTGERVTAFVGDLASTATASGRVTPRQDATLALPVSGRVDAVRVAVGDQVGAGDVLVELDAADLQRVVDNAAQNLVIAEASLEKLRSGASAADIASAQAAVNSAQAALDTTLNSPTPEQIAASEANLRAAQANLNAANANYNNVTEGPAEADLISAESALEDALDRQLDARRAHESVLTCSTFTLPTGDERTVCASEEQIDLAEANVLAANAEVEAAQAQVDALRSGASQGAVSAASGSIAAARANRDAAQASHDLLLQGATPSQIAAAQAQLAQAEATLATVMDGVSAEQLAIAAAQVEQARIALERAQSDRDKAILRAPFDGTVTAVFVAEGELASGPAVTLINKDTMEVVLSVDEVDLATLTIGQPGLVTLEAYPDVEFDSAIVSIAPLSTPGQAGLVTYDVYLSLPPTDVPLLANMTANAELITADRSDVLLVPNSAITADRTTGRFYVNLVDESAEDGYRRVEVTTGLRDNRNTEITSGLEAGNELIIGSFELDFPFGDGPPGGGPFGGG